MSYKFELHSHSKPTSLCSTVLPEDLIDLYKQKGYDGVVVTNHYYDDWFRCLFDQNTSEEAKIDKWLEGYRNTKSFGEKLGITVLLGAELRFSQTGVNDYLLYGCDEEFLLNNPKLYELGPEKMHDIALKNGFYFGQAHPCRDGCTPVNPTFLDGMEVYNGHPSANNHMDKTHGIVKDFGLISTVGTDFHEAPYAGRAAILLDEKPETSKQLAQMLLSRREFPFAIPKEAKNNAALPFASDDRYIAY